MHRLHRGRDFLGKKKVLQNTTPFFSFNFIFAILFFVFSISRFI